MYHLHKDVPDFLQERGGLSPFLQHSEEFPVDGDQLLHVGEEQGNILLGDQARGLNFRNMHLANSKERG